MKKRNYTAERKAAAKWADHIYTAERKAAAKWADHIMNLDGQLERGQWLRCWGLVFDAYLAGLRRKSVPETEAKS